jgi:hypothetical protein
MLVKIHIAVSLAANACLKVDSIPQRLTALKLTLRAGRSAVAKIYLPCDVPSVLMAHIDPTHVPLG